MLRKYFLEVFTNRIADNNEFLWNSQIFLKKFRMPLKKALTAFVENEKMCAGIVTIIWNYKESLIRLTDCIQQLIFHIIMKRAEFSMLKAFIITISTWSYAKICKWKYGAVKYFALNIFCYFAAVSKFSWTKWNNTSIQKIITFEGEFICKNITTVRKSFGIS